MLLKNGKELLIRKARKEDAAEIISFLNTVGGESDYLLFGANEFHMTVEQEEQYIEKLESAQTSALIIGLVDGRIICSGSISAPERERVAHQSTLGLSVAKEFWGLGVGGYLMEALIDFARTNGKTEVIHLKVRADNARAIALYKKLGFQEIGVYPKYAKINGQYYDDILMNLYL